MGARRQAKKELAKEQELAKLRAAEARNPDASTPAPDASQTKSAAVPSNPAEAAGLATNQTAGDGKPVGDSRGNEETK